MVRGYRGGLTLRGTLALAAAALIGLAGMTTPARADPAPSAGGSCGPAQGVYGRTGVGADEFDGSGNTVPALYYRIDYNLMSPSYIVMIARFNDDLGVSFVLAAFPSNGTGGSYEGVWRADIRPENSGWNNSLAPATGRFDGPATSQRLRGGPSQSYYTTGGLTPGGWMFYLYTGELLYDSARGYHFVADEKGYLGKFACNVADDDAKN